MRNRIAHFLVAVAALFALAVPAYAQQYDPQSKLIQVACSVDRTVKATDACPLAVKVGPDAVAITITPQSAAGNLFSVDTTSFDFATVQLTGTWVGTVSFEESNDNTNWSAKAGVTGSLSFANSTTSNNVYHIPVSAKFLRARVSTYTSGTFTATAFLRTTPPGFGYQYVQSATGTGSLQMQGNTAAGSTALGNPVRIGCTNATGTPSLITNGQVGNIVCSTNGVQIVWPFSIPELTWQSVTALTTTSDVSVRAAGGAGVRNYVASAQLANTGAAVAIVNLKDNTTIMGTYSVNPGETRDINFSTALRGTAATVTNAACLATCTVTVNLQGFNAP